MDVAGLLSFLTELFGKVPFHASNRPRLGLKIIEFRRDPIGERWVFRASVLNHGRIAASNCEGFWSIFDQTLREVYSGNSVYWTPTTDDDYHFQNRDVRFATIESSDSDILQ
jgi:hypothetical protein